MFQEGGRRDSPHGKPGLDDDQGPCVSGRDRMPVTGRQGCWGHALPMAVGPLGESVSVLSWL